MNLINQKFDNLAQRSVCSFLITYPPFTPVLSSEATEEEQKSAYLFIREIYERLYNNPSLLGLRNLPDDSFNDWEYHKTNPQLVVNIRGGIKKVEQFIALLYQICLSKQISDNTFSINRSDMELKISAKKQLAVFGINTNMTENEYIFLFPIEVDGLRLLANISKQSTSSESDKDWLLFSRGVFDPAAPWTQEVFKGMFDEGEAFEDLMEFFQREGYLRIDGQNSISLNYIKNYSSKEEKLKSAWAERTHGGIEIIYEETRRNQPLIALRIPYFDQVLIAYSRMNDKVKRFVLETSKKCDNCGYCTQTDKTGKRPRAYITNDEFKICPLFCGYQYRWKSIDYVLVENMIELLQFVDEIFHDRAVVAG